MYKIITYIEDGKTIIYAAVPESLVHLFNMANDVDEETYEISESVSINTARAFISSMKGRTKARLAGTQNKDNNEVCIYRFVTTNDKCGYFWTKLDPVSYFKSVYEKKPYHPLMVDIANGIQFREISLVRRVPDVKNFRGIANSILQSEKNNRRYPLINGIAHSGVPKERLKVGKTNSRPVTIYGNQYPSIQAAMDDLKMTRYQISQLL